MTNEKEAESLRELLVARQPIFDRKKDVFAYELVFEPGFQHRAEDPALKAVDTFLLNGLKTLSEGRRVFINFTPEMLVTEYPLMFPSDVMGISVLEKPTSRQKMAGAVRKMKKAGYLLMLGDRALNEGGVSLLKLVDIVGCDFRRRSPRECGAVLNDEKITQVKFLAKGVETATDYQLAGEKGYEYFQGDFFNRADIVPVRNIPSYKVTLLKVLKEINKPDVRFDRIEEILKRDVSITYKLLRFINSAKFGLKTTVNSIRHALTLLGETEVRKWLSLIVLSGTGTDKTQELLKSTIIRARFCETIAEQLKNVKDLSAFFLMGMFSMVEAFLDRPLYEILSELPLEPDIKAALMGKDNRYRHVLDAVLDYERGDWTNFSESAGRLNLDEKKAVALYFEAVEWASLF